METTIDIRFHSSQEDLRLLTRLHAGGSVICFHSSQEDLRRSCEKYHAAGGSEFPFLTGRFKTGFNAGLHSILGSFHSSQEDLRRH